MATPFPKLRSYLKSKLAIHDSLGDDYYCGCGINLDSRDSFKDHIFFQHNGIFIGGSSHYISSYLHIIVPVSDWKKPQLSIRIQHSNDDSPKMICDHKQTQTFYSEETENEVLVSNISIPSKKKTNFVNSTDEKMFKLNKGLSLRSESKQINCNKLTQTKKEKLQISNFLEEEYFQTKRDQREIDDRQIEDCLNEKNKNLVNSLKLSSQDSHGEGKQLAENINNVKVNQFEAIEQKVLSLNTRYYIRPFYRQSFPNNLLGIFQMIRDRNTKEVMLFICGCGKQIELKQRILGHLSRVHKYVIPDHSSHINIRLGSCKSNPVNHWLKIKPKSYDLRLIWSCPCQPDKAMNRWSFIQHTFENHQGISPFYKIINLKYSKQI